MTSQSKLEFDPKILAKRRQLHSARQERERQRRAVVAKFLRATRRASLLRGFINAYEALQTVDANSEIERMLMWARARLNESVAEIHPDQVSKLIAELNLFPVPDTLADPLGDPPPRRPWGR